MSTPEQRVGRPTLTGSASRASRVLLGSDDGFWEWSDLTQDEYWWSPRFYEILGYDDQEFVATRERLVAMVHPEDLDRVTLDLENLLKVEGPLQTECRLRTKSGAYAWTRVRASVLRDETGRPYCVSGTIRDVSRQHLAEMRLRESEALFRSIFDNSPIGTATIDLNGRFIRVNDAFCRWLGYTREEMLVRSFLDITPPEDIEASQAMNRQLLGGVVHYSLDKRYRHNDGSILWGTVSATPVRTSDGNPQYLLAQVQDITEKKRAADGLRESECFLRSVLDSLSAHVAILDEQGLVIAVNEAWRDFARANDADVDLVSEGSNYLHACRQAGDEVAARTAENAICAILNGSGECSSLEYPCHSQEKKRWFAMQIKPLLGAGSTKVVVTHEPITDRKIAEEKWKHGERELRRREATLAHLHRVYSVEQMAITLTHELNQPLSAINNYVHGLRRRLQNASVASDIEPLVETIECVSQEVQRAAGIVSHLRDFVRGREPRRSTVDLRVLLQRARDLLQPKVLEAGVTLELEVEHELPLVQADPIQVEQVVINLVANAIEAVAALPPERRSVTVESRRTDGSSAEVVVSDLGPGIPEKLKKTLFEGFVTTKEDGLGLGLAICRSIVEAHGGVIWTVPNVPHGAVFHFTLPIDAAQQELPI